MNNLTNKIEANDTCIKELLKDQKFYIDYFQREYRWKEKHIKLLIEDLSTTFLKSYEKKHERKEVDNYQTYFLGPVVFNIDSGKRSIIDGQQRITSLTLLLIYLNHLQNGKDNEVQLQNYIFSEKFGEKSFNMTDETREPCLKALFEKGEYILQDNDDETILNMIDRYEDITESFPEELTNVALPYFIDWLTDKVIIVEIIAYSDESAYAIFETMNDRGLNLTPTEMLKGYVLSQISDLKKRNEINEIWKENIQELHKFGETSDQSFFHAWFRAKYAETIRPGQAGAENKDFELISSKFHNWFKENHRKIFNIKSSEDFYDFFKNQFPFYIKWQIIIWNSNEIFNHEIPYLKYIDTWGIAESLQAPLLLSSIKIDDNDKIIKEKINNVARFIETFTTRRAINYKKFGQTSIKYTMFNLIKEIRNNTKENLGDKLINQINSMEYKWNGIENFGLHGQNKKFVKHLLSRITSYLDMQIGKSSNYTDYYKPKGKQFEIEHIWSNKFNEYKDEFEQENDFLLWRNHIGGLILLPNGSNQSYGSDKYVDKIEHYLKENILAQSLHPKYYEKNPNFMKNENIIKLNFKSHKYFKKEDMIERQNLIKNICEEIWAIEKF